MDVEAISEGRRPDITASSRRPDHDARTPFLEHERASQRGFEEQLRGREAHGQQRPEVGRGHTQEVAGLDICPSSTQSRSKVECAAASDAERPGPALSERRVHPRELPRGKSRALVTRGLAATAIVGQRWQSQKLARSGGPSATPSDGAAPRHRPPRSPDCPARPRRSRPPSAQSSAEPRAAAAAHRGGSRASRAA